MNNYLIFIIIFFYFTSLANSQDFILNGSSSYARLGLSVGKLNDVNNDGINDVAVSDESLYGTVNIISGLNGAIIRSISASTGQADFGGVLRSIRDINNDGITDLVVRSRNRSSSTNSLAYLSLISGANGELLNSLTYQQVSQISIIKDLDDDGYEDIVFGTGSSSFVPTCGSSSGGEVNIVSGKTFSLIHTICKNKSYYSFGFKVGTIGDVNNDGKSDIIVGTDYHDFINQIPEMPDGKFFLIYSGADYNLLYSINNIYQFGGDQNHIAIPLNDINMDGYNDFALSVINVGNIPVVKVISGVNGSLIYEVPLDYSSLYGPIIANVGDLNFDGIDDIMMSTNNSILVISGCNGNVITSYGQISDTNHSNFGTFIGDSNHDGSLEFIISKINEPNGYIYGAGLIYHLDLDLFENKDLPTWFIPIQNL